jgi:uncharacterized membrane protein YphA (DoxX/SURF4 family)
MNTETSSEAHKPDLAAPGQARNKLGWGPLIARLLMGLGFTVFGLNGFLDFIPKPKEAMPEGAAAFAGALMKSGYIPSLWERNSSWASCC